MTNTQKIIYDEKKQQVLLNGKPYTKDEMQSFSITFLILGILAIVISFFIMPLGIFTIAVGIYLLIQAAAYNSTAKILENRIKKLGSNPPSSSSSDHTISDIEHTQSSTNPTSQIKTSVTYISDSKSKINTPHENHNVAGTSFRQKEIASLGDYNFEYEQTKKEIIENYFDDEKIYEITFNPLDVQLVEEPDNEYDPHAIKVVIDGIHVGYIKKGSCSHIKKLISSQSIQRITADIHGGKYKNVYSTFDDKKMDDVIHVESGRSDYFVSICIYLKE